MAGGRLIQPDFSGLILCVLKDYVLHDCLLKERMVKIFKKIRFDGVAHRIEQHSGFKRFERRFGSRTFQKAWVGLCAVLAMGSVNVAHASDYLGYIHDVVQIGSRVFVYVGDGSWGTDSCGSSRSSLIVYIDPTTAEGKAYVALALNAKAQAIQVYVSGTAQCWGGGTPNGGVSEPIYALWLH